MNTMLKRIFIYLLGFFFVIYPIPTEAGLDPSPLVHATPQNTTFHHFKKKIQKNWKIFKKKLQQKSKAFSTSAFILYLTVLLYAIFNALMGSYFYNNLLSNPIFNTHLLIAAGIIGLAIIVLIFFSKEDKYSMAALNYSFFAIPFLFLKGYLIFHFLFLFLSIAYILLVHFLIKPKEGNNYIKYKTWAYLYPALAFVFTILFPINFLVTLMILSMTPFTSLHYFFLLQLVLHSFYTLFFWIKTFIKKRHAEYDSDERLIRAYRKVWILIGILAVILILILILGFL